MTTKEKAKAYDKAIEAARCIYNNMKENGNFGGMENLSVIFPEFEDSEDEKIRKELLQIAKESEDSFYMVMTPGKREKLIAWLEKQNHDGKKWIFEDVYLKEKEQAYQDGIDEVVENPQDYGLKKQKPVEPNWVHHKVDLSNCSEEDTTNCNQQHSQAEQKSAEWRVNGVYPENDGVRIWHDRHTFKVLKKWNKGRYDLLTDEGYEKSKQNTERLQNEAEALLDWDFVGATEHIQKLGTDIPLDKGEFLPTAPVYLAMYKYKDELNAALKAMGAEEIDFSEDTWFAQRYNMYLGWIFYGNHGQLGSNGVYSAHRVLAVTL